MLSISGEVYLPRRAIGSELAEILYGLGDDYIKVSCDSYSTVSAYLLSITRRLLHATIPHSLGCRLCPTLVPVQEDPDPDPNLCQSGCCGSNIAIPAVAQVIDGLVYLLIVTNISVRFRLCLFCSKVKEDLPCDSEIWGQTLKLAIASLILTKLP